MKKNIIIVLAVFMIGFLVLPSYADAQAVEIDRNLQIHTEIDDTVKITTISNIKNYLNAPQRLRSSNALKISQIEEQSGFQLEEDVLLTSESVIIQEESFYKDADGNVVSVPQQNLNENSIMKSGAVHDNWSDSEGYLTIYSSAYNQGEIKSNHTTYYCYGEVIIHKNFKLKLQDRLILHHSYGTYNGELSTIGQQKYYEDSWSNLSGARFQGYRMFSLTPVYSQNFGVDYAFKFPENGNYLNGATNHQFSYKYTNWSVKGQYRIDVFSSSNFQVQYIHNEKFFATDLSISIGQFGITINGSNTTYNAEPLALYK